MKMKMKVGDVVQLSGDELQIVKALAEEVKRATTAFYTASDWLHIARQRLWAAVRELHPELGKNQFAIYQDTGRCIIRSVEEFED